MKYINVAAQSGSICNWENALKRRIKERVKKTRFYCNCRLPEDDDSSYSTVWYLRTRNGIISSACICW